MSMKNSITLADVQAATSGRVLNQGALDFTAVGTDTRADLKGQLFIALRGENFDAHNFLEAAVKAGAIGLIVDHVPESQIAVTKQVTTILVADSLKALQKLGQYRRRQSQAHVLGITGSNGKTTSKEFAAALIGKYKPVHYNQGSFNNHWGVPLTLLGIQPQHQVVICEMGMNHPGELTELAKIAEPETVVVTTVGRAHLEGLGSLEAVATAKEELYLAAPVEATRIFNLDNMLTKKMLDRAWEHFPDGKIISFSSTGDPLADVEFKVKSMSLNELVITGSIEGIEGAAKVPVFGMHNVTNLMVAASCGLAVGLTPEEIWAALPLCKTAWGRNQLVKLKSGAQVLFDGYNANPDSMRALLDNLKQLAGQKQVSLVLGEMRELGDHAASLHEELGKIAGKSGCQVVWFVGQYFKEFDRGFRGTNSSAKVLATPEYDEKILQALKQTLSSESIVAIKGSRGMKMERFLLALEPVDFKGKS